jgi:hypothetical protein
MINKANVPQTSRKCLENLANYFDISVFISNWKAIAKEIVLVK